MFSSSDIDFIKKRGSSTDVVEAQIQNFKDDFPPLKLEKAATIGDGLSKLSEKDIDARLKSYESATASKAIVKFVPASGAASRMFKDLFSFMEEYTGSEADYQKLTANQKSGSMFDFFKRLEDFAFYDDLKNAYAKSGTSLEEAHLKRKYVSILEYLLLDRGLGYGQLPKGLLKFHKKNGVARTPAEEHFVEGANYAKSSDGSVKLHFTVSPEHRAKFKEHVAAVQAGYEKQYGVKFEVSFSEQKASTDTIAVDMSNQPFRENDGGLLFRPAGHGALLSNLNDLNADVIFVKNIDNVVPDRLKEDTFVYKKVIASLLLEYQSKIFGFLEKLEAGGATTADLDAMYDFLEKELCTSNHTTARTASAAERSAFLKGKFNRPIRICGMVKNEGEPGGGPFWCKNPDGTVSLQIVESAQVDLKDAGQKKIFEESTHFNPVDLVCGTKDYSGKKFDLMKFTDPKTGFVTEKSKDGKALKAQELPGLWNGSMSNWNTVFVEVPVSTFNPVKKVTDLLKDQHQ
ncbi:DUF4301 family protein [Imperialibacter roseus]|uniref:DUF4301 family protein n=1 Tax=Imperialibacter roseus TaxID=1324217 RepID=A0ABZ0IQB3_9BACT|nr:DUF4301 family protein [Imperialibacter roseus]WOK06175.1 DUF4301 family protein [Imperialibacter roseus]